jgi:hypothetical protein
VIANSLRLRLLIAAAVVVLIALQMAGAVLYLMFERSVVRQVDLQLAADIEQLAAHAGRTSDGGVELTQELSDPRFRQPLAGRYWQIMTGGRSRLRSRSLWDEELSFGAMPQPRQGVKHAKIKGPDRQVLYAAARTIILEGDTPAVADLSIGLIAAIDATEIETLKRQFLGDLLTSLGWLAAFLIAAAWVQVSVGLSPFTQLTAKLEAIRLGRQYRLDGMVPDELRPLVTETNRLLEAQEQVIEKVRARAGDLAHGLKTPLTALTVLAHQLREEGRSSLAASIDQQVRELNSHVERELARTRIAAEARIPRLTEVGPAAGPTDHRNLAAFARPRMDERLPHRRHCHDRPGRSGRDPR